MSFLVFASQHHVDWEHSSSSYLGTVRMWRLALKCPLRVATYDKTTKNTGSKFLIQREKADKWELLDSSHADIDILMVIIDVLMVWHRYLHSSSFTDNFIQHSTWACAVSEFRLYWMKLLVNEDLRRVEDLRWWASLTMVPPFVSQLYHKNNSSSSSSSSSSKGFFSSHVILNCRNF